MSKPTTQPPDFDEEFTKAVAEWRDKHRLREDDAVILLVELFRIHQRIGMNFAAGKFPPFPNFARTSANSLTPRGHFRSTIIGLVGTLRSQPMGNRAVRITRTAAIFAALACLLAGYLIGRAWR
jgi:hypothetical protein